MRWRGKTEVAQLVHTEIFCQCRLTWKAWAGGWGGFEENKMANCIMGNYFFFFSRVYGLTGVGRKFGSMNEPSCKQAIASRGESPVVEDEKA